MKQITHLILLNVVLLSLTVACTKNNCIQSENAIPATINDYTGLDGCSWVLKLENGQVLEPSNLNDFNILLEENRKVWVEYHELPDQASICMVGPIIEIDTIWYR